MNMLGFTPFSHEEIPQTPGYLCAIDAEFVVVSKEETEISSEGARKVIRPNRVCLARLSVVRGEGPHMGVPFIDEYIAATEPVVDYLTEYSGIEHGDLDPTVSPYYVTPLKVAENE